MTEIIREEDIIRTEDRTIEIEGRDPREIIEELTIKIIIRKKDTNKINTIETETEQSNGSKTSSKTIS